MKRNHARVEEKDVIGGRRMRQRRSMAGMVIGAEKASYSKSWCNASVSSRIYIYIYIGVQQLTGTSEMVGTGRRVVETY